MNSQSCSAHEFVAASSKRLETQRMPIDHSELRKRECHCAFFPFRAKAICKIAGETASIDEAMQKIANGWLMHGESEMKGNRYAD